MLWELGVLASVSSFDSKIHNIGVWRSTHRGMRDCCVPMFTEIWFNNSILETGIEFDWLTLHRADRVAALSGKHREGGLVVYTNDSWFRDTTIIRISGSQKVEYMIVICQPFHLPQENQPSFCCGLRAPECQYERGYG